MLQSNAPKFRYKNPQSSNAHKFQCITINIIQPQLPQTPQMPKPPPLKMPLTLFASPQNPLRQISDYSENFTFLKIIHLHVHVDVFQFEAILVIFNIYYI